MARLERARDVRRRARDRLLGERRRGRHHLREVGGSTQVASDEAEHDALAQGAQSRVQGRAVGKLDRAEERAHRLAREESRKIRFGREMRLGVDQGGDVARVTASDRKQVAGAALRGGSGESGCGGGGVRGRIRHHAILLSYRFPPRQPNQCPSFAASTG